MTTSSPASLLAVENFLAQHPALVPLVAEAPQAVQPYFPGAPLVLEVFAHPEFGDLPKLHLVIVPTTYPGAAASEYARLPQAPGGTA